MWNKKHLTPLSEILLVRKKSNLKTNKEVLRTP